ncbi:uncharacterized protein LOC121390028 [Gigantopelta aegis]|uniref:uncharacterized protein LOC121390028 n=1 Tax=Gigantopelta aegis TaxID=1735272 RepID=UPI001B88B420|nr:uncharacterized protein LOC121390028 [Gigantopelta aegis]XP_041377664.1 uncharacterized protein LOC121390028 [Gigantopelta aegis]
MLLEVVLAVVVLALTVVIWTVVKSKRVNIEDLEINGTRRPLGRFEKFMAKGHGSNATIAHACIVSSKHPLSSGQVQKAAEMLTDRYQLLRSRVDDSDPEKPCFVPMDNFTVPMKTVDSTSWQDVLEERVMARYNTTTGPLWSVSFLPKVQYKVGLDSEVEDAEYPFLCGVVFGFHHVIIDGCSRIRLADHFLTYLDDVIKGVDTHVEPMKMLPAMEYYTADEITPSFFFQVIDFAMKCLITVPGVHSVFLVLFGQRNVYTEKCGLEEDKNPNVGKKTCIIPMEFSREDTSRLLTKCRENNATVYGAVQTSVSLAFAKLLQGGEITKEMELPVGCTINLRPFIKDTPVPADCLGSYFAPMRIKQTIKPLQIQKSHDDFWKMASQVTELIKNAQKQGPAQNFKKYTSLMAHLNLFKDRRCPVISALTNLGNCKFLERTLQSEVKFRAMHSCTPEHDSGPIFSTRVITFNGQLFWTICYYTNVTSRERAIEFADLVKETLKEALT